jgi:hypothetical protein
MYRWYTALAAGYSPNPNIERLSRQPILADLLSSLRKTGNAALVAELAPEMAVQSPAAPFSSTAH